MPTKPLQELLLELDETLRSGGTIKDEDRELLEQLHVDLTAVLGPEPTPEPHTLRDHISDAIDRVQAEHPRLSSLLSATLDALSDLGL
jgi:hypothetical protein